MKVWLGLFIAMLIGGGLVARSHLSTADANKAMQAAVSRKVISVYIPVEQKYDTPRVKLNIEERYLAQPSYKDWVPYSFAINYKTLQPSDSGATEDENVVNIRIFPSFNEFIDGDIRIEENWRDPPLSVTKFPDRNTYLFGLNYRKRCMNGERCTRYHSLFLKDQKPNDFYIFCPNHVEPKFCNMFMIWHARSDGRRVPAIAVKVTLNFHKMSEWAVIEKSVNDLLYDKVSLVDE